jgi:hypothetical protein
MDARARAQGWWTRELRDAWAGMYGGGCDTAAGRHGVRASARSGGAETGEVKDTHRQQVPDRSSASSRAVSTSSAIHKPVMEWSAVHAAEATPHGITCTGCTDAPRGSYPGEQRLSMSLWSPDVDWDSVRWAGPSIGT